KTDETVDSSKFSYTLMHRWLAHPKTRWNLTELVDTGQRKDGEPVYEERPIEITGVNIDTKLHKYHRTWIQGELSREFYPEMFGGTDPNSLQSGKSGTSGTRTGSGSGSKTSKPSQESPSQSQ